MASNTRSPAGPSCLLFWELCRYTAFKGGVGIHKQLFLCKCHDLKRFEMFKAPENTLIQLWALSCERGRWSADGAENSEAFSISVERDGLEQLLRPCQVSLDTWHIPRIHREPESI